MSIPINFSGSIPQHYNDYLTGFLFDPFAEDIVKRASLTEGSKILELAAGTGCVTRKLIQHMPASSYLTATDLQAGMLQVAQLNTAAPNLAWAIADMTNIPYENDQFDVVLCQFGIMLVPDRFKALQEMHRVLKPGAQLLFNIWGDIHENQIWEIGSAVIGSYLPNNPITQDPGPFSMDESLTLQLLKDTGFSNPTSTVVSKTGRIETSAMAAKGFLEGLPVAISIRKTDPELLPKIEQALEEQLSRQLGNHPLKSTLQALVFSAIK